jgi:trimethylamine:corrinoid methyltransferase-like protein
LGSYTVTDERLALDSIAAAGPGGNFLTDPLTLRLLRSDEFFASRHLDLSGGYAPEAAGMYEMAHRDVERLVAEHRPAVPSEIQQAIRAHFRPRYRDPAVADLCPL